MSTAVADLQTGRDALARGAWAEARDAFERSIAEQESPEALEGLGVAAWWLDLAEVVFDVRERAYRLYQDRKDAVSAARVAVWLAWDYWAFRGEDAVANGWLQRARRLLEGHGQVAANSPGSSSGKARSHSSSTAIPTGRFVMRPPASRVAQAIGKHRPRDARPVRAGPGPRHIRRGRGGHAHAGRGQRGRRRRRTPRPHRDRPGVLLSHRRVRSRARLRPRDAVVHAAEGVLREMGAPAAVCRVPHAVRVDLHVARHLARGGARVDGGDRRARGQPSGDDRRRARPARRAAAASGAPGRSGGDVRAVGAAQPGVARTRGDCASIATTRRRPPSSPRATCGACRRTTARIAPAGLELLVRALVAHGRHGRRAEPRSPSSPTSPRSSRRCRTRRPRAIAAGFVAARRRRSERRAAAFRGRGRSLPAERRAVRAVARPDRAGADAGRPRAGRRRSRGGAARDGSARRVEGGNRDRPRQDAARLAGAPRSRRPPTRR